MPRERAAWIRGLRGSTRGAAAAFFAGTLALVGGLRIHAALHLDTARDLLIARECVLGGHCGAGPRTSFGGWTQGALWSHLLELREALGLGLAALEHAAILGLAIAAAMVPVAAREVGRSANALTWALWFPATLWTIGYPTLWNPTLWPLALVLFYVALARAARSRSLLAFTAAAAALALAVDLHVASAVLVPFLIAAVVGCSAHPWLALPTVAVVALGVLAVDSPGALAENRPLVGRHAPALILALALAVSAGLVARRRLTNLDGTARAETLLRALCLFLLVALTGLALGTGHPLHARYLAPIVTPAAILLSTGGPRLLRSPRLRAIAAALACAGYVAHWLDDRLYNPRFRLVEVEAVAAALYDRGLDFGALYRHLRGPHAFDLVSTLAALEPPGTRGASPDAQDLLVVRAARTDLPESLPAEWSVVDLEGSHVAVIVPYRPWVQLDRVEVCRDRATGPLDCATLSVDGARFAHRAGMRWTDRAFADLPGLPRPNRGERVTYHMSYQPADRDAGRRLRLFADACKGWRIALPGTSIADAQLVDLSAANASGELAFTVTASPRCRWWLPPFAELPALDPALDRLLPPLPPRDRR